MTENIMLKNYIQISVRYLKKNKLFSVINVLGLSFGLTAVILIALFLEEEFSFDKFHKDYKRIYRVVQTIHEESGSERNVAAVAARIGPEAVNLIPEVTSCTRLFFAGRLTVGNEILSRDYERIVIVDTNFLGFFDFKLKYGDIKHAMNHASGIVLTENTASKYFGNQNVTGKDLYTNVKEFTVAGILEDFPQNSHLDLNMFYPFHSGVNLLGPWQFEEYESSDWTDNAFLTYVKLAPNANPVLVADKINAMVLDNYPGDEPFTSKFYLQSLTDIHLENIEYQAGMNVNKGNIDYIYLFSLVGLLVFIIAVFNFANLYTTVLRRRSNEIATRKVVGAEKKQIISQYALEAFFLCFVAYFLALTIAQVIAPVIGNWLGRSLQFDKATVGILFAVYGFSSHILVFTSVLTSYNIVFHTPAKIYSHYHIQKNSHFIFRKLMVILQLIIGVFSVASTFVIVEQLNYLKKRDTGFQMSGLVTIDINSGNLRKHDEAIKNEFLALPEIEGVTTSTRVPGEWKVYPIVKARFSEQVYVNDMILIGADESFMQTYDISLIQGRNFKGVASDSSSAIINQTAFKLLGKKALNDLITITDINWGGDEYNLEEERTFQIVGVCEDFHFESFRNEMKPMIILYKNNPFHNIDYYTLKIDSRDWEATLQQIKKVNNKFDPENPVEYYFLEDQFYRFYENDKKSGLMLGYLTISIIIITIMGLFALVSFMVQQKIKEFAVRKTFGATGLSIQKMVYAEFLILVIISSVVAIPLAYVAMQSWLSRFAYTIEIPLFSFSLAFLTVLFITIESIFLQVVRASKFSPALVLRGE